MFMREVWRELSDDAVNTGGRTDSKRLKRVIVTTTEISNRRLRIDMATIKESIEVGEMEKKSGLLAGNRWWIV